MRRPTPASNSAKREANWPPRSARSRKKRWSWPQQFADEARVEAELAAAKAGAVKAIAVNEDIKRSTATLIEEMQRKTGDSR